MTLPLLVAALAAAGPSSDAVLLDFTATWCGPCQQMNPIISRLERQGYPVRRVDVDREPEVFRRFGVRSMPTFLLVVDGREAGRIVGPTTEAGLKRMLAQLPRATVQVPPASQQTSPATAVEGRDNPAAADAAGSRQGTGGFVFPFPAALGRRRGSDAVVRSESDSDAGPAGPAEAEPVVRAQSDRELATAESIEANPLASSVRLRVRDRGATNYGSATIIDSRPGRTVLLSCGHVFRDLTESAEVVVDAFVGGRVEQFRASVLKFDLQSDVGLLSIATSAALPASPVAVRTEPSSVGETVYSVGCGGGEPPSRWTTRITDLQPRSRPSYTECGRAPDQGRSGGGLFNNQGEVIGVCFAADSDRDRGLYASLDAVHRLLEQADLAYLLRRGRPSDERLATADASAAEAPATSAVPPFSDEGLGEQAATEPRTASPASRAAVSPQEIEHVERALGGADGADGAEVICIIRPRGGADAPSRVVVINRASPRFVEYLTGELRRRPQETARKVPADAPRTAGWCGPDADPSTTAERSAAPVEKAAPPVESRSFVPQRYQRSRNSR